MRIWPWRVQRHAKAASIATQTNKMQKQMKKNRSSRNSFPRRR